MLRRLAFAPQLRRGWSILVLARHETTLLLPKPEDRKKKVPMIPTRAPQKMPAMAELPDPMQYVGIGKYEALTAEGRLLEVSEEFVRLPGPHAQAAAADAYEANIVEFMARTKLNIDEGDETLFRLLTACYLARLPDAERKACGMDLGWTDAHLHLDLMVDFACQEFLSGKSLGFCDAAFARVEDVSEYIEELWANFCHVRNIQVNPEDISPRTPIAMDLLSLPPYRKLANAEFRWRCGENGTSQSSPPPPLYAGEVLGMVPKFSDLACMIADSDCFHYLPVDRLGWNMREFARAQPSRDLSNRVEFAYSHLVEVPVRDPPPGSPGEFESAPLLVKELKLLLEGICNNKLLRSLTTQRPPLSVLTHHHAVTICAQHARIWLARYDLKLYYDHSLTYAQLCTQAVKEEDEEMVFREAFCKERIPSALDEFLRISTYRCMCDDFGGEVMHLRPEDYDKVMQQQAPDKQQQPWWRGFMEKFGHPVLAKDFVSEAEEIEGTADDYVSLLLVETKSKKGRDMLMSLLPPEKLADLSRPT